MKRPKHTDFDLLVIGTGAGGGVAAHIANKAGKRVAVIEAEKLGGECPNFGCVPTKALLHAAEIYETAKSGAPYGIHAGKVSFDYKTVKAWKDIAVQHTGAEEGEAFFATEGVRVIRGRAHFIDPWTVSVAGRRYTAHKILIASGTTSVIPPIPGLKEAGYWTYRDAIEITSLPKSLFVLGGGAIGCEFTHLFTSFGVSVHIADISERLLAVEDSEVGDLLGALFENHKVGVHTGVTVTRVEKVGGQKVVHLTRGDKTEKLLVDEILIASGKAPNTDLGLENAGVMYDKKGIPANEYMQTSVKHIYTAGDITGPYRFTHTASYQSRIAVHNMFHNDKVKAQYHAVPRCVFTYPEIGCVGLTEQQLQQKNIPYQTAAVPITVIGRANTSDVTSGFVKLIAAPSGRMLGGSIVSPRAGEMIHEVTLAVQHGLTARQIAETIHAFPTWNEAVRVAAQKLSSK